MAKQTPDAVVDAKKSNFLWADEETAHLVQVVIDYKASQSVDGNDWETIKNRYAMRTCICEARWLLTAKLVKR